MDSDADGTGTDELSTVVQRYLEAKAKGRQTGNYRTMATSVLSRWVSFQRSQGITTVDGLNETALRRYAQHLRRHVRDGEFSAATARTYYATVRACLQWAVEDGQVADNPAAANRARSELPEDTRDPDRQFWDRDDVQQLLSHLTAEIDAQLDEGGIEAAARVIRDRALVSTLAYTGVRGAEVFRDTDDDRNGRQGLRWENVNLADGALKVLGKTQTWEWAQLPPQARDHLERHRTVQSPPDDRWPVFPTAHSPSKYRAVREQLATRGWMDEDIESLLEDGDIDDILREHEVVPPAITVRGARSLLKRRCDDAGIDGEYLKPHGARRGLGDRLYRESAELAQTALRHTSIRTTHDAYSHIDATETAETVGELLEESEGDDVDV